MERGNRIVWNFREFRSPCLMKSWIPKEIDASSFSSSTSAVLFFYYRKVTVCLNVWTSPNVDETCCLVAFFVDLFQLRDLFLTMSYSSNSAFPIVVCWDGSMIDNYTGLFFLTLIPLNTQKIFSYLTTFYGPVCFTWLSMNFSSTVNIFKKSVGQSHVEKCSTVHRQNSWILPLMSVKYWKFMVKERNHGPYTQIELLLKKILGRLCFTASGLGTRGS
jgi:hypothetical protein